MLQYLTIDAAIVAFYLLITLVVGIQAGIALLYLCRKWMCSIGNHCKGLVPTATVTSSNKSNGNSSNKPGNSPKVKPIVTDYQVQPGAGVRRQGRYLSCQALPGQGSGIGDSHVSSPGKTRWCFRVCHERQLTRMNGGSKTCSARKVPGLPHKQKQNPGRKAFKL